MRRTSLVVVVVAVVLGVGGCAKKKNPVAAPATIPPPAAAPALPSPPPPQPPSIPPETVFDTDPLDTADLDAVNAYVRRHGLLGDVYFAYDRAELGEASRQRLDENAAFLTSHPELVVVIEGHCDERGTAEYNLALGDRRAGTAVAYVGSLGVATDRLRSVSYGKERPVCDSASEDCWQRNRRASFVIAGRRTAS